MERIITALSRGEQSAWLAAIAPYNAGEPAPLTFFEKKVSQKTLNQKICTINYILKEVSKYSKTKYSHCFSGNRKGA